MLYGMRLTCEGLVVAGLVCYVVWAATPEVRAADAPPDPTLVLHYTFDQDTGDAVKDMSGYDNDAKIEKAEHLREFNGRSGVLRFDGKESLITVPKAHAPSLQEDLSFEMWIRQNGPITSNSCTLLGSPSMLMVLDQVI